MLTLLIFILLLGLIVYMLWPEQRPKKEFSMGEVRYAAKKLGIPFDLYDLKRGMDLELEHGRCDPLTNVTNDDPIITAKIAWAHLNRRATCYSCEKKFREFKTELLNEWD